MASDLEDLVRHGREERNLEYKASFPWSGSETQKHRVIRTCLGMSNLPDGGAVVVGIAESPPGSFVLSGLEADHEMTLTQDQIQSDVNLFADPYADVTVSLVELTEDPTDQTGPTGRFAVIQVRPFETIPVICKRDGSQNLRAGAMYTRARKKHETIEVPSQTEMREIISRATRLSTREFIDNARAAGILSYEAPSQSGAEVFDAELGDL